VDVKEAIERRRAYRSLSPFKVTEDLIMDLARCAQITASCFNKQPWRFIFVYHPDVLKEMHTSLSPGNEWACEASMIIVVAGRRKDDCVIGDRIYYTFDIGMAVEAMILRATELGLVAHPIAGFSPNKVREILDIPEDVDVITLIIVGKHSDKINPLLSPKQVEAEKERPARKDLKEFVFVNKWNNPWQPEKA